ncbi:MAG TPA: rhodanese-like domain-containing protein [Thermoanaerobaculia bacterium]
MICPALLGLALSLVTTPGELASRAAGTVTILDARAAGEYRRGHVPGAIRIDWTDFREGWGRTGKLPRDLEGLARRLAGLGVDSQRLAVVYGKARQGWGEEGRIVWMLAYLGHPRVQLLDGGWEAWLAARQPISVADERPLAGGFRAAPVAALRASAADVARTLSGGGVVLDVRSDEEWRGATPYHEARGGHIPGAVHVEWKELLDARGRIDPAAARARLLAAGVKPAERVITYCTGGVRSAEAWVILRALGYADVRNYDGSWFEWSADAGRAVGHD